MSCTTALPSPRGSEGGVEPKRGGRLLAMLLVSVVGYGPLLCAVTAHADIKEFREAEMTWDTTMKTGKVV